MSQTISFVIIMFSTATINLCLTFLNFLDVRCAPELPSEDSYGIISTEWAIRNTVNSLFSTLKLKVLERKLKLKQYSTIHNFFASMTLRDHENLKKIAKLTYIDNIDNGTYVFITQLNEVLNEDNKSDEVTDSVYVTILIEDFINKLDNLKESNDGKKHTKFDLNKAILRYFSKNENEFGNTTYVSKDSVKGNVSDDCLLSSCEFWQPNGRRIFGGQSSTIDSFPFMASVQFFFKFQCGGSIIKSDLVITSASCVQIAWNNRFFRENPAFLSVQVGSTYYERGGENIPVMEIEYHPGYNPKNLRHNLAIMRLSRTLNFREKKHNVRMIDFDRNPWPLPSNIDGIVVVGWGSKTFGNKLAANWKDQLSYSKLDFYPLKECQEIYTKEFVTDRNFCAGFFSKGGGACNHDAGGPGVSIGGILTGVISFASPQCGAPDAPTVFTKLGYYTNWIEEIMEKTTTSGRQQTTLRPPNYNPTFPPVTTTIRFKITPIIRGKKPFTSTPIPESNLLRDNDKTYDFKQFLKTLFKKNKQPKNKQEQQQKQGKLKEEHQEKDKWQEEEERNKEQQEIERKKHQDEEEQQDETERQDQQDEEEHQKQEEDKQLGQQKEKARQEKQQQKEKQEQEQQQERELTVDRKEPQEEEERQEKEETEQVTEKVVDKTQNTGKVKEVKLKPILRIKPITKKENKVSTSKINKESKSKEEDMRTTQSQSHSEENWNRKSTTTLSPCTIFGTNNAKVTILDYNNADSADITSYEILTPSFKNRNSGNKEASSGQEEEFDEAIDSILDTFNINYIFESKESFPVDQQRMRTKDLISNTILTEVLKKKIKKSSSVVENKNINRNEEHKSGDKYDNNEDTGHKESVEIVDKSSSGDSHSYDNPENKYYEEEDALTVNEDNEMEDYETEDGGETNEEFKTLPIPAKPFEQEHSISESTDKLLDMLDYEDLYKLLAENSN